MNGLLSYMEVVPCCRGLPDFTGPQSIHFILLSSSDSKS